MGPSTTPNAAIRYGACLISKSSMNRGRLHSASSPIQMILNSVPRPPWPAGLIKERLWCVPW